MDDYFRDGGMVNSAAVQDHLLRQFMRNAEQLNFKGRAALLDHLQALQKIEIAGTKPKQETLPFIAEVGADADGK